MYKYFPKTVKWGMVVLIVSASSGIYSGNSQAIVISNSDPLDISDWVHLKKPKNPFDDLNVKSSPAQPIFHKEREVEGEQWTEIIKPEKELVHFNNYKNKETIVTANGVADNGKEIILMGVHGTNSTPNGFGADMTYKNTQGLMKYAHELSAKHGVRVRVMSFQWSGKLNEHARKEAGDVLAQCLKDELNNSNVGVEKIVTYGHSHGCNVISHMAKKLQEECNRSVDCAIQVASPTSDLSFTKNNLPFEKMYHFYGSADTTQGLGSFFSRFNWNRKLHTHDERVHNIRLMKGNRELNHVDIKCNVVSDLPKIIDSVEGKFPHYRDLEISVDEYGNPLIGIRHKKANNETQSFKSHIQAQGYSVRNKAEFKDKFGHDMSEQFGGKHKTWLQKACNRVSSLIQEIRSARDKSIK